MNPNGGHCADNKRDRATGAYWERQFCRLATRYGRFLTPHQIGRPGQSASAYGLDSGHWRTLLLPDITVWSAPGEHHEIKHKNKNRHGNYGLETYRLDALMEFAQVTGQPVYYTIHDWELAGARSSVEQVPNDIAHWFCADVTQLAISNTYVSCGSSYVRGERREVEIQYWDAFWYFQPLGEVVAKW